MNEVLLLSKERQLKVKEYILSNYRVTPTGCWEWTQRTFRGYSQVRFYVNGKSHGSSGHRVLWLLTKGPITDGLVLDHLCRNRACINSDHLEPVTNIENIRRGISPIVHQKPKTHCIRGHDYSPDNTIHRSDGAQQCRKCTRLRLHKYSKQKTSYYHRHKEHVLAVQKARLLR